MAHDSKSAHEEAANSWPLPRIFAHYGLGHLTELTTAQLKREPCPFCGKKGKFVIFRGSKSGRLCCRCWSDSCPGYGIMDEIAFIQRREGLPDTQHGRNLAFKKYLELAGITIERRVQDSTHQSSELPAAEEKVSPESMTEPANRPENLISFAPNNSNKSGSGSGPSTADVWAVFHSRLPLTAPDRARLKEKRGFTDETIDLLKFRPSIPGNIEILESLRKDFPDYLLIESGLFKMQSGKMIPECQFAGRGVTGEKDEKGEPIWGITNPIIIPYLDPQGRILTIRPHKGNIAKKDKDDDETCLGDIYCPFLLESRLDDFESTSPLFGTVVLTESEFKAAALWQAGFPAVGIPGVSFVRNPIFRTRLVDLLSKYQVKKIIIVFDNEVKDNPALPSYKPDPFDRYWTIVWARYIAWDLMNCSPRPSSLETVLISQLPDEWRLDDSGKDTGKIDWDTALANFVAREGPVHGTARATREFERVLLEAHSPKDFIALFPAAAQVIIQTRLDRLWYTPLLRSGGAREEKLARRLEKIGSRSTVQIQRWSQEMVEALRSVNGTYYVPKLPTDKERPYLLKLKEDLDDKIAELKKQRDERTAPGAESIEEKLDRLQLERRLITGKIDRGIPRSICNFTMECRYCLHTAAGETDRMVIIRNNQGEQTSLLRLPGSRLGRLAEFRIWCLGHAQGVPVWGGGEKDVQALTADMKKLSAGRNVHEVPYYGFHSESKIWFAGDCAWAPDGSLILPNDEKIVWHGGLGYMIPNSVNSAWPHSADDGFQQGAPSFIRPQRNEPGVRDLFELLSEGLVNTVGDHGGLLCIGCMLLYAAAPELCREYGGHPGLWLYGRKGSGKNTVARWLMKIWGFKELSGIRLDEGTTPVAVNRVLLQNSCIPVWFDESRRTISDIAQKESVLRGAFDRSSAAKGRLDSSNRTQTARALTTPLVTGESSSGDAATRSRYVHINLSPSRRLLDRTKNGELLEILRTKSDSFYLIGKYLMDHRAEFVSNVLSLLKSWMENQFGISDDRTRFVHGASWAAYIAFAELLNANCCDPKAFGEYVVRHSCQAFEETHDETMVNRFWLEVIAAINTGAISRSFFFERAVPLTENGGYDPGAVTLDQTATTRVIFMASQEIYNEYEKDMRHRGNTPPLSRNDIGREISNEPYWIKAEGSNRVHRISQNGKRYACWAIHLDKFPFGQLLSDALQTSSMT
jgi:hypothetical protein